MKINILLFLFVESFVLVSCSHVRFSCDKYENQWAEDHLQDFRNNVARSEITEIPLGRQFAIYNGLSADVKYELWKGKFELLLKRRGLTEEQSCLFQDLMNYISPKIFEKDYILDSTFYELQRKFEVLYAQNTIDYFFSVCTWMTEEEYVTADFNDRAILTRVDPPGYDEPQENCTCRHDIGCFGQGGTCEKSDSCEQQIACGFLGKYYCDGQCD